MKYEGYECVQQRAAGCTRGHRLAGWASLVPDNTARACDAFSASPALGRAGAATRAIMQPPAWATSSLGGGGLERDGWCRTPTPLETPRTPMGPLSGGFHAHLPPATRGIMQAQPAQPWGVCVWRGGGSGA
jgi:hypothetical protein